MLATPQGKQRRTRHFHHFPLHVRQPCFVALLQHDLVLNKLLSLFLVITRWHCHFIVVASIRVHIHSRRWSCCHHRMAQMRGRCRRLRSGLPSRSFDGLRSHRCSSSRSTDYVIRHGDVMVKSDLIMMVSSSYLGTNRMCSNRTDELWSEQRGYTFSTTMPFACVGINLCGFDISICRLTANNNKVNSKPGEINLKLRKVTEAVCQENFALCLSNNPTRRQRKVFVWYGV